MGLCSHCLSTRTYAHLLLFILLLFSSSSKVGYFAEGRQLEDGGDRELMTVKAMIGSRPPRCERRCITCGHCEAVQVPAVPQKSAVQRHFSARVAARGDDTSNYKPMSWKCKCGDTILNP